MKCSNNLIIQTFQIMAFRITDFYYFPYYKLLSYQNPFIICYHRYYHNYKMQSMVGEGMSMTIQWGYYCVFFFKAFKTEHVLTFLIGCIFSFFIAALTVALPALKQKFVPELVDHYSTLQVEGQEASSSGNRNKIKLFIYYLVYSLAHIMNMLIIMTMNFWVILFVLAGVGTSFYFFCSQKKCCH